MKQGKTRASSEIQDVENFGNFCKVVPVPHLLVPVPRLEKVAVTKWYRYHTYWYRYQPRQTRQYTFGTGTTLIGTDTAVHEWAI